VHELSIATEIYRLCRARIPEPGPARLERVSVLIGELSAVEPDLLRFAWEALTSDGPDAGAVIEVEWRPARQVCDACAAEAGRARGEWNTVCPRCGRPLRIEGGQELDVIRFSFRSEAARAESPA
jgi:hydrogenase nickel incorporation protein HypA/HybF